MIAYRLAASTDADAIAALHTDSWRRSYRGFFLDDYLDGDILEDRLQVWRACLDRPDPLQYVCLAEDAEGLVGFVCARGAHDEKWGSFIDNLHVVERAKRRGVASALMRRAAFWLSADHAHDGVHLLAWEENAAARRLYARLGGRDAEVFENENQGGGTGRSCRIVWDRPAEIAVRQAIDADIPEMRRVRASVRENTLPDYSVLTEAAYRRHLHEIGRGFVFDTGERIGGLAIANRDARTIWALFVEPELERRGIGRALHDRMLRWLQEQGIDQVELGTEPGTRAARFYEAAGWQALGPPQDGEVTYRKALVAAAPVGHTG